MLKKELRLSQKQDIADVFRKGFFLNFGQISLRFIKKAQDASRIGVFVGIKYSKRAVDRNRIRRKISGIVERRYAEIENGFDIAIIPTKKLEKDILNRELDNIISAALEKAALIKK